MERLNDRVTVGVVGGLAGHLAKTVVSKGFKAAHLAKYDTLDKAAGMFIRPRRHPEPAAVALGEAADAVMAALFGVGVTYLLSATGTDRGIAKGAMAGAALWAVVAGGLSTLGATANHPVDPKSALVNLSSHLAFGAVTAAVIERVGAPEIFNGEMPLIQR